MKQKHEGNECPVGRDETVRVYLADGVGRVGRAGDFAWGPGLGPEGEGRIEAYEVVRPAICPCAPGRCSASPQGRERGHMSIISDIKCRAASLSEDAAAQDLVRAVTAWSAVTGIATTPEQRTLLVELLVAIREVTA